MPELQVVATIPVKEGSEDAVRTALVALVEATRHEKGCISYDLFESQAQPGTFVTIERWRDAKAMDNHMKTEHLQQAFAAAGEHLSGEVTIHPLVHVV